MTEWEGIPAKLYEGNITFIPKPEKDTIKNYKSISPINKGCKNPQQNTSGSNPAIHQKGHPWDQLGFMSGIQGCFNICKSTSWRERTN